MLFCDGYSSANWLNCIIRTFADAALILHDDEVEITAENLEKLVLAAKVPHVDGYWFGLFAKALATADVSALVSSIGSASAGPAAAAAAPAAGGAPAAAAAAPGMG